MVKTDESVETLLKSLLDKGFANRELPLTVGGLPVFSRAWGGGKPFDQVVMDIPIGSGPYRIGPVNFGRDITYLRDPAYWARDLPVRRGTANFDRITVKIYKDNTARLEALKAGEFDLMRFFSAGDWARRVNGRKFDSGVDLLLSVGAKRARGEDRFQDFGAAGVAGIAAGLLRCAPRLLRLGRHVLHGVGDLLVRAGRAAAPPRSRGARRAAAGGRRPCGRSSR